MKNETGSDFVLIKKCMKEQGNNLKKKLPKALSLFKNMKCRDKQTKRRLHDALIFLFPLKVFIKHTTVK